MKVLEGKPLPAVATSRERPSQGRRISRGLMLTATVAVLITAAAGCVNNGGHPAAAPVSPSSVEAPRVVFYAEGSGTKSGSLTMRTETGGTVQKDVALPMVDATTGQAGVWSDGFKRGDQLYFSVQNSEGFGSVTCRIKIYDQVIDEVTSSGGFKIATCVGQVP